MKKLTLLATGVVAALMSTTATVAMAKDKMTLYCSAQDDWCQLVVYSFEEASGVDVSMTRKSSGETFAQIKAEATNPRVMFGGVVPVIHTCKPQKRG